MLVKRIMLVEDDDFYIEVIGTFVKLFLQHQMIAARSPNDALKRIHDQLPDLILLDLTDSGDDALTFVRALRDETETKQVPILALSQTERDRERAGGAGCDALLIKPFKVRELEKMITDLLGVEGKKIVSLP